jgi:RHS repeat-associated protein
VLTNSSGAVVEESDYYPYGQEHVVTGTGTANNYKYSGLERDTESGLDHTQYRQLSSAMGRWLTPDLANGTPANPQSWNKYSYAKDDPANHRDPTGLISIYIDWGCYYEDGFIFDDGSQDDCQDELLGELEPSLIEPVLRPDPNWQNTQYRIEQVALFNAEIQDWLQNSLPRPFKVSSQAVPAAKR